MPSFLVETYAPERRTNGLPDLSATAQAAASTGAAAGLDVRHVRSFATPGDEVCFHVFEAPSLEAVASMSKLACLDHERITEVIE
ncbi:MAG: DUF4242 domain-containing protein [Gaiellaceae bacterium MAG52_C11]|nr:DUF4242 domain-containing protein [Candidatus Gaiellasilicea maunaloa]